MRQFLWRISLKMSERIWIVFKWGCWVLRLKTPHTPVFYFGRWMPLEHCSKSRGSSKILSSVTSITPFVLRCVLNWCDGSTWEAAQRCHTRWRLGWLSNQDESSSRFGRDGGGTCAQWMVRQVGTNDQRPKGEWRNRKQETDKREELTHVTMWVNSSKREKYGTIEQIQDRRTLHRGYLTNARK